MDLIVEGLSAGMVSQPTTRLEPDDLGPGMIEVRVITPPVYRPAVNPWEETVRRKARALHVQAAQRIGAHELIKRMSEPQAPKPKANQVHTKSELVITVGTLKPWRRL